MATEYLQRMGAQIDAAMQAKGWKQGDLARAIDELRRRDNPDAAHVEPSSISRYKRGVVEPSPAMKQYLADALGITVAQLMGPEPDKSETPDLSLRAVRDEFRPDVDGVQEQLAKIQADLKAASRERLTLRAEIKEQNDLLARQSEILAKIEKATAVLDGVAEVVTEPAEAEKPKAPPMPPPPPRAAPEAPPRTGTTGRADRPIPRRRRKTA